jgi:hypothetical protein
VREVGAVPDAGGLFDVESQGDHEYLVRLHGSSDAVESWFRLTPGILDQLGGGADEEDAIRRTVTFLLRYQDIEDFPSVVELEDVIASYPDYVAAMTS